MANNTRNKMNMQEIRVLTGVFVHRILFVVHILLHNTFFLLVLLQAHRRRRHFMNINDIVFTKCDIRLILSVAYFHYFAWYFAAHPLYSCILWTHSKELWIIPFGKYFRTIICSGEGVNFLNRQLKKSFGCAFVLIELMKKKKDVGKISSM